MPRDRRAVIGTGLWLEDSIRGLTRLQQQAYFLAYTQPDINRCGVVPYRLRSWAKTAADATEDDLHRDYLDLHTSRHVVLDEADEQLLIRTYVRHDGLLTQPLVIAAMIRDFFTITSQPIRYAFLAEIRRLHSVPLEPKERQGVALSLGADPAKYDVKNAPAVAKALGSGLAGPMADAIAAGHVEPYPEKGLPEGLPEGYREGLTKGLTEGLGNPPLDPQGQGQSRSPVPITVPVPPPVPVPVPTDDPTGALLTEHVAAYDTPPPPSALIPIRREIMRLVAEHVEPDRIRAGLTRLRERQLAASLLPQLVTEMTPTRRPSTTDQRVADGLALVARYEAAEEAP